MQTIENNRENANFVVSVLQDRLRAAVRGRDSEIDLVIVALLADGHVLLEDFPGSGKTTLARAIGASLQPEPGDEMESFRRIQFTPDLLPSDITGAMIFDPDSHSFRFRRGPVFAHIVLADEINRTSPKVQSAMLEAMGEKQVTIENTTHDLDELFFVIATQNPIDLAGTYPLPSPQLDRFLFKIVMKHIDSVSERSILDTYPMRMLDAAKSMPTLSRSHIVAARRFVRDSVRIDPAIKDALVSLASHLRADPRVLQGASTRSLVLMMPALQAQALLQGRDYVIPADVERLVVPIFSHRLETEAGSEEVSAILEDASAKVQETLARSSLRYSSDSL